MPARLRGINMTAATRFETRYVTRANLATRYASRAAQFSARVESTLTTDTSHFASSLAPTMRRRKEKEKEGRKREREKTNAPAAARSHPAILASFAPLPADALTRLCTVCIADVLTRSEYA